MKQIMLTINRIVYKKVLKAQFILVILIAWLLVSKLYIVKLYRIESAYLIRLIELKNKSKVKKIMMEIH